MWVICNFIKVPWHKRDSKTSPEKYPRISYISGALWAPDWAYKWLIIWFSTGIKASERRKRHAPGRYEQYFSSQPQWYSKRNLHRTPVLAGDVPARSTAWRGGRTQSACGFTRLHCASSPHHSHSPFLPTFHSQVRGMGKSTLSFCLLGSFYKKPSFRQACQKLCFSVCLLIFFPGNLRSSGGCLLAKIYKK
jgi:hypothetical protein